MFNKILNFFKKDYQNTSIENYITLTLNDKIMPIDRGELYEDILNEFLTVNNLGEITGSGTLQLDTGELSYCDIEIGLYSQEINKNDIDKIIDKCEELGAPKGSRIDIESTNEMRNLGKLEGIGIYLDGINLPKETYEKSDINFVISEFKKLLGDNSEVIRYWEGNSGTALYFYGKSFKEMKNKISCFLNEYPLCKNAEIKKIA